MRPATTRSATFRQHLSGSLPRADLLDEAGGFGVRASRGTVSVDFLSLKPGDLNDDNKVSFHDLPLFSTNYGTSGNSLP